MKHDEAATYQTEPARLIEGMLIPPRDPMPHGLVERILVRLSGDPCPSCGMRARDLTEHYDREHGGEA